MIERLQVLFSVVMCYRHNIHMLHWKVAGKDFDTTHKILDNYVSKFNLFVDEIAEMLLSIGGNPLTIQECMNVLVPSDKHILLIESKANYTSDEAYKALDIMFNDLYNIYSEITSTCEYTDCASKLDEHKYWLRVEGLYKNKKRLS